MTEYQVGDVLTLKVPVTRGNRGPVITVGGQTSIVPGHPQYQSSWESGKLEKALIVGCESPLRVGDKVLVKYIRPNGSLIRSAVIMAELPGEPDIFMVQYDRYKNYWYRKHRSNLTKDTNQ